MSSSNCCFLTCMQISQEAGQVVWYSHLFQNFPQLIVIHTVKGFDIVNKAEIDVFLELSCFFDDKANVGNLISVSSAFLKPASISGAAWCRSGWEELPHVQGKRNPCKMVGTERGHQRADRLKPQLQTTSQSDHMDHSFVLLNETKPCHVGPPKTEGLWWRGLTECGPLEKGMANYFNILALRTPWAVWKAKKIGHWKINSPGQ